MKVLIKAKKETCVSGDMPKQNRVGFVLLLRLCLLSIGDNYMYTHFLVGATPINWDVPVSQMIKAK